MRTYALLLLLTALAAAQAIIPTTQPTAAQTPYIAVNVVQSPPIAYPGSIVQLNIVITSTSAVGPLNVEISSPSLDVLAGGLYKLPGLAPGTPVTLTAVVEVPWGTSAGTYEVDVGLVNAITGFQIEEQSYSVKVYPIDYGSLVYLLSAQPLAPGQVAYLPVLLINPTYDVMKANVTIASGPLTQFANASLSCAAYIPPHSNSTCVIPAQVSPAASAGSYTVGLNVTYTDLTNNATVSFQKNATIYVLGSVDFNLALVPQGPVVPGIPAYFQLVISTGGTAQPLNVTITPLNTSTISILSPKRVKLPVLTQAQIPIEAVVGSYGSIAASFKICYFNGLCLIKNATLYLPYPNLAINVFQNPPWAYPGSIIQLMVVLASNQPVGPLDVSIEAPGLEVLEGGEMHLPGLAAGMPVNFTAIIEVPSTASPGTYPIVIRAGNYSEVYELSVDPSALSVNVYANPPVAYPGSVVQVSTVLSSIAALRGVNVSVSTPLEVLEGSSFYLPLLPSGSPITLTSVVKVPDNITPGIYPIYISVNGETYTAYVHVESGQIVVQGVALEPPEVIAGGPLPYIKAVVSLVNTGLVPARGVVVSLSGAPVIGNSTVDLGVLPPGQPVQIPFLINASALGPGESVVAAQVSWLGGSASASSTLTVLPKADLAVSYSVEGATPGSTAVLTLTIENKGPVEAKMVTLQWTPNQVFQIHTPSSSTPTATLLESGMRVLGDIGPGQSVSTTYLLDVSDKVPPGVYYATIVIEWNETGSPVPAVETIQVPIQVSSSINWLEVGPAIAAVVVVAAGVALYLSRRRK
jgi:hypothetical protein